nr:AIR synthase family protein [Candidatus Methanofastidiosa archaeon]
VIASDPVTGASKNIGYHAVYVNSNDIAATGADPRYMTAIVLLREHASEEELRDIMHQINTACEDIGAYLIGGHTEMVPDQKTNIICGTMFGWTSRYVPTSGARPGDSILLTKGAGIEGTSILAHERADELSEMLGKDLVDNAKGYSKKLSILSEARLIRDLATSMHDPTEGGVAGALNEMAIASGFGFDVDTSKIPVSRETREICAHYSVDPLNLISSGTLMATIPERNTKDAASLLEGASIPYSFIGKITENGRNLPMPEMDALWEII